MLSAEVPAHLGHLFAAGVDQCLAEGGTAQHGEDLLGHVPHIPEIDLQGVLQDLVGLAANLFGRAAAQDASVTPRVEGSLAWYDVRAWGVEGKGWAETARFFDRLPAKAEGVVPAAVWNLSRHSAGMLARFETDASAVHARYTLINTSLALPIMPATGVSGLDLYARDEQGRGRALEGVPSVEVNTTSSAPRRRASRTAATLTT